MVLPIYNSLEQKLALEENVGLSLRQTEEWMKSKHKRALSTEKFIHRWHTQQSLCLFTHSANLPAYAFCCRSGNPDAYVIFPSRFIISLPPRHPGVVTWSFCHRLDIRCNWQRLMILYSGSQVSEHLVNVVKEMAEKTSVSSNFQRSPLRYYA
jgi:hypothetical protein